MCQPTAREAEKRQTYLIQVIFTSIRTIVKVTVSLDGYGGSVSNIEDEDPGSGSYQIKFELCGEFRLRLHNESAHRQGTNKHNTNAHRENHPRRGQSDGQHI